MPSTVATGRCSVSQAKACGTRVKTSSCTGSKLRLARGCETGGDEDHAARRDRHAARNPRPSAAPRPNPARGRRSLRPGATSTTVPSVAAALLLDAQADELEDVVLVLAGRAQRVAGARRSSAPRATRRSSRITGRPRACFDATTSAGSPSAIRARADLEELGCLARVLDDERPVQTMRLADASDDDRLSRVHATARSSRSPRPHRQTATRPASRYATMSPGSYAVRRNSTPGPSSAQYAPCFVLVRHPDTAGVDEPHVSDAPSNWTCVCPQTTTSASAARAPQTTPRRG